MRVERNLCSIADMRLLINDETRRRVAFVLREKLSLFICELRKFLREERKNIPQVRLELTTPALLTEYCLISTVR